MIEETLADRWIEEMEEMGLTLEQMLEVIKIANERYQYLINNQ
jgi:hypothetical protein